MCVVVGVTRIEHRVEQLLLGFEVMQQPGRRDAGLLGYLGQRGVAPAIARQQSLGHREDPLPAVLALGQKRGVRAMSARAKSRRHLCSGHLTPSSNQPSEHTVGWFAPL